MYELINNISLKIKEYKGQCVVTFRDIDMVHNRPEGTARKRFNDNRKRFIEDEDYFILELTTSEIRTQFGAGKNAGRTMILLTESGYLMLVKSFTDELAWSVQRQLVKTYFRVQEINSSYAELVKLLRNDLSSDMERVVNTAVEKAVSETVKVLALYMKSSEENMQTKNKIPCRKRNYHNGKILSLPQDIRRKVDDMIISGEYSCQKIADFIEENTGIEISYMTVSRYIKKYFMLQK